MYVFICLTHRLVAHSTSKVPDNESFIVQETAMGVEFGLPWNLKNMHNGDLSN